MAPLGHGPWPLKVSQRCLGILARVLLARQQKALQISSTGMDIEECINVWKRLIDILKDYCLTSEDFTPLTIPGTVYLSYMLLKLLPEVIHM